MASCCLGELRPSRLRHCIAFALIIHPWMFVRFSNSSDASAMERSFVNRSFSQSGAQSDTLLNTPHSKHLVRTNVDLQQAQRAHRDQCPSLRKYSAVLLLVVGDKRVTAKKILPAFTSLAPYLRFPPVHTKIMQTAGEPAQPGFDQNEWLL